MTEVNSNAIIIVGLAGLAYVIYSKSGQKSVAINKKYIKQNNQIPVEINRWKTDREYLYTSDIYRRGWSTTCASRVAEPGTTDGTNVAHNIMIPLSSYFGHDSSYLQKGLLHYPKSLAAVTKSACGTIFSKPINYNQISERL